MLVTLYALSVGSPTKVCLDLKCTGWCTSWLSRLPMVAVTVMCAAPPAPPEDAAAPGPPRLPGTWARAISR